MNTESSGELQEPENGEKRSSEAAAPNGVTSVSSSVNTEIPATEGVSETSASLVESTETTPLVERENPEFEDLAEEAGLKPVSIGVLRIQDYDSVKAVATITDVELEALTLSLGQRSLLRAWATSLKTPTPGGHFQKAQSEAMSSVSQLQAPTPSHGTEKEALAPDSSQKASAPLGVLREEVVASNDKPQASTPVQVTEKEILASNSPAQASTPVLASNSPPQASVLLEVTKKEVMASNSSPQASASSQIENIFTDLAKKAGLKPPSITKLLEEEYDSAEAVGNITAEDLEVLKLSRGQKSMLRAWVSRLKDPASSIKHTLGENEQMAEETLFDVQPQASALFNEAESEAILLDSRQQVSATLHSTTGKSVSSENRPQASTERELTSSDGRPHASASSHPTEGWIMSPDSLPPASYPIKDEAILLDHRQKAPYGRPQTSASLHTTKGEAYFPDSRLQPSTLSYARPRQCEANEAESEAILLDSRQQVSATLHSNTGKPVSSENRPQASTERELTFSDGQPHASASSHPTEGWIMSPDSLPPASYPIKDEANLLDHRQKAPYGRPQTSASLHTTKGEAYFPDSRPSTLSYARPRQCEANEAESEAILLDSRQQVSATRHSNTGKPVSSENRPQASTERELSSSDGQPHASASSHPTEGWIMSPDSLPPASYPIKDEAILLDHRQKAPYGRPQTSASLHTTKGESYFPDSRLQPSTLSYARPRQCEANEAESEAILLDSRQQVSATLHSNTGKPVSSENRPQASTERELSSSDGQPHASASSHPTEGWIMSPDSLPPASYPIKDEAILLDHRQKAPYGRPQTSASLHTTKGEAYLPDSHLQPSTLSYASPRQREAMPTGSPYQWDLTMHEYTPDHQQRASAPFPEAGLHDSQSEASARFCDAKARSSNTSPESLYRAEHANILTDASERKKKKREKYERTANYETNYQKMLTRLELNLNNLISLQQAIEVRESPDKPRLSNLPMGQIRMLMGLDYRARDHFLSEMGEKGEEDDSFTFEYHEVETQESNLPPNPMDVLLATFSCCDISLQQILARNMFLCKLAIPLIYPVGTSENLVFSLWALRAIIVQCSGGSKPSEEVSVTDTPFPIITFVRVGSPSISKSNLLNSVLTEGKLQTFYSSECQRRSERRKIADGLLECSWFLPAFEEADLFSSVVLFLNLRGDASMYQKQMGLVNEVSSVIVAIADIEDIAKEPDVATFKKICSSDKQIVQVLTSQSKHPEQQMVRTQLTSFAHCVGRERLHRIKQIFTFRQNAKTNDLKIRLQELLPKLTNESGQMSLQAVSKLGKTGEFQVDEDDPVCREGNRQAMNLMEEIEEREILTCKRDLVPLQGEVWAKYTELQKKLHRFGEEEGSNALKDQLVSLRREQAQMCNNLPPFIRSFLRILVSTEKEVQKSFLQWMKLLLDSKSRRHLPRLHRNYFGVWRLLHNETTQENQEKISKAEKDITDASFGLEHIFRELGQLYEAANDSKISVERHIQEDIKMLPKAVAGLLLDGTPLELVDGDTSSVPITWVKAVLSELDTIITTRRRKLFVISVLGVQSSGKSTLLNTMFGLQFAVSAGRCTRGAFMQLIKVARPGLHVDYIAVIDTEGLRAPELAQLKYHHDNELATFAIGLGDMTLINIKGENTAEIKDALQITVHAFIRMKLVNKEMNIERSCIFIHQNVPAINAKEKMMQSCQKLQDQLDEMTKEAAHNEGTMRYRSFSEIIQFDINEHIFYFLDFWQGNPPMAPVNVGYSKNATSVKHFLEKNLKHKKLFLTVQDLARRIEDLRSGILSEDFVFSFRNSMEVKAYNSLEERFCRLKWELECSITDWITRVAQIELRRCDKAHNLDGVFCSLTTRLTQFSESEKTKSEKLLIEFFDKSEYNDIIIQWRQGMLNSLAMELRTYVTSGMKHLHMVKDELGVDLLSKEDFDSNRAKIMQHASTTADILKGRQASDFELNKKFNEMWSPINQELTSGKYTSEINIEREIRDVLTNLAKKFTVNLNEELKANNISQPLKGQLLAESLSIHELELNHHFSVAEPSRLKRLFNWVTGKPSAKDPKYLSYLEECRTKLINATRSMLQTTDDYLNELSAQGVNFQRNHASSALQTIMDRMNRFKLTEGKQHPTLSLLPAYTAKLVVLVSRRCHTVFDKMQSNYKKKHGIDSKVHQIREEARKVFYHKVKESTEVDVAADLFCHQLKAIVESTVEAAIPNTIVQEVIEHFALRKYHLMMDILDGLAMQEGFMGYASYIGNSKSFAAKWVKQHIHKQFFTESSQGMTRYGELIEMHIKAIIKEVKKSIRCANERALKQGKSLSVWLSAFCEIQEIPVKASDFETFSKRNVQDFSRLEAKIMAECEVMKKRLAAHYNMQKVEEIEWKGGSPNRQVVEKLWGCPAQCPFCGEPCSLAVHDVTKEHHCLQHRPQGISGTRWMWSSELVADTCNYLAQSGSKFSCNFHEDGHEKCEIADVNEYERFHPYKEYKTFFPEWDITPDAENAASEYWAWFMNKYQDRLAEYHRAEPPCVPEKWELITKDEALKNLRKDR